MFLNQSCKHIFKCPVNELNTQCKYSAVLPTGCCLEEFAQREAWQGKMRGLFFMRDPQFETTTTPGAMLELISTIDWNLET